mmetsp:Transcript_174156/g.423675  ORF Transcript_174156/g.423675 Transcript_174156/m.423675 type:complete len:323 (-) Transcript_174156:289-1257(-)
MTSALQHSKSESALPVPVDGEDSCGGFSSEGEQPGEDSGAADSVHNRAAVAAEALTSHLKGKLQMVQDARTATYGYVASAQTTLLASVEDLRKQGTKAFVLDSASHATIQVRSTAQSLAETAAERLDGAKKSAVGHATSAAELAKAKASEMSTTVRGVAADEKFQVSVASAASGAAALGASAGAAGLTAGGALGAAAGLVPALFTFGLSIPIGAAIGGGAGLVVGTAVGGTVGAVGGGAAGYGAYSKKEEIGECAEYVKARAAETKELIKGAPTAAFGRARDAADFTKARAHASAEFVAEKASAARSRLVGRCSTGGTESTD